MAITKEDRAAALAMFNKQMSIDVSEKEASLSYRLCGVMIGLLDGCLMTRLIKPSRCAES